MARIILSIIVLLSILLSGYSGYDLIVNSKTRYAPEFIFTSADEGVLLVRKINELQYGGFIHLTQENPFTRELQNIDAIDLGKINYYLSASRGVLLLEKNSYWKKGEIKKLTGSITLANTSVQYDGIYAVISVNTEIVPASEPLFNYKNGDKKASANYWNLLENNGGRTDIYALNSGYYQYKSSIPTKKYGKSVADAVNFSTVLPQTIEKYEFMERFYALEQDSALANGPLALWLDKGIVTAEFNHKQVLVTDYRAQQTPSLILMDYASNADSIILEEPIKHFKGIQLTSTFPQNFNAGFYLFEIEDKTLFTESLELVKKIQIAYQMGETLGLNQQKNKQLFSGLPTYTNYRKVEPNLKVSITFKNDLQFAVTTVPPGEQLSTGVSSNWTNGTLGNYAGFTPIIDHIRTGYSLFTYDEAGNYALLSSSGNIIWSGKADTSFIDLPQSIDIFENDKHQILFTTHKSVYLIDLNGNYVGSFPYTGDHRFSASVSYFRWKNTTRFLVGNTKGELTMLNTTGSELNIVQASPNALKHTSFALNINGNLRGWCIDTENERLLTYLEQPVKTEKLGKTTANQFEKVNGEVIGFIQENGAVKIERMTSHEMKPLAEGQLVPCNTGSAVKLKNTLSLFEKNHQLTQTIELGFNEVAAVHQIQLEGSVYTMVLDYFKNNIYCYNAAGELLEGFPKEGSTFLTASYDNATNELSIYTIISNSVVCHKIILGKNL
ncbi:MAG: hypothetical protein P8O07_09780 [Crocinitomicaceae bacterium]|nr:hypothetical protein [Crocinitomicaceae bacterium]